MLCRRSLIFNAQYLSLFSWGIGFWMSKAQFASSVKSTLRSYRTRVVVSIGHGRSLVGQTTPSDSKRAQTLFPVSVDNSKTLSCEIDNPRLQSVSTSVRFPQILPMNVFRDPGTDSCSQLLLNVPLSYDLVSNISLRIILIPLRRVIASMPKLRSQSC